VKLSVTVKEAVADAEIESPQEETGKRVLALPCTNGPDPDMGEDCRGRLDDGGRDH
jgi:hypothetical protein